MLESHISPGSFRDVMFSCDSLSLGKNGGSHLRNSLEGGREGVLTGVEAVRVLIRRKTGCLRCLRWALQLAASGVFFQ